MNRMHNLFVENGFKNLHISHSFDDANKMAKKGMIVLIMLDLQHGFNSDEYFIVSEQDIWGERKNIRTI